MDRYPPSDSAAVEPVDGVTITPLAFGEELSTQQFEIESGAVVPEHEHHHEQAGVVYEGELTFLIAGEELTVHAGESFFIPSNEPHAAENTGETPVRGIDVFSPPRSPAYWEKRIE